MSQRRFWAVVVFGLLGACTDRSLEIPEHGTSTSTASDLGTHSHVCPAHPKETTLATTVTSVASAFDGDNVYYEYDYVSLVSVPRDGGDKQVIAQTDAAFPTVFDHHLLYGSDCGGTDPSCAPAVGVTDRDLTTGSVAPFATPWIVDQLAVAPDVIWGAMFHGSVDMPSGDGLSDLVRIDRQTGESRVFPQTDFFPDGPAYVVGRHAFFHNVEADEIIRVDLDTNDIDRFARTTDAMTSDGQQLLLADDSTFTFFDENMNALVVIPHEAPSVLSVTFDANAVYWGTAQDADVRLTWRDGSGDCAVAKLAGSALLDLQNDDEAIYAQPQGGDFDLFRIDK